jgi:hypothetical protein
MTRKDFELIAKGINLTPYNDEAERGKAARVMAHLLAETNPRFDRDRFIAASLAGHAIPSSSMLMTDYGGTVLIP